MKFSYTLFFALLSNWMFAQQEPINYKYNHFEVLSSDSLLTIEDTRTNVIDTLFMDVDKTYYFTENGEEVSKNKMEKLKSTDPQQYNEIIVSNHLYVNKENARLLSIVGPYISYTNEFYNEGGAHPSYGKYYYSYNLETKKTAHLTDFFSPEALFAAFIKNEFILKYVKVEEVSNLAQLLDSFSENAGCDYSLNLSSFSFGEIQNQQVNIYIGVAYNCEVARGNFELVSIQLDIPDSLKVFLESSSKAGLLDVD